MKTKGAEWGLEGVAEGQSGDAGLHEPLLKKRDAAMLSDLAAVNAGLRLGLPMATCLRMFAGDKAFRAIADQGFKTQ
jgi:hypothetical protein